MWENPQDYTHTLHIHKYVIDITHTYMYITHTNVHTHIYVILWIITYIYICVYMQSYKFINIFTQMHIIYVYYTVLYTQGYNKRRGISGRIQKIKKKSNVNHKRKNTTSLLGQFIIWLSQEIVHYRRKYQSTWR